MGSAGIHQESRMTLTAGALIGIIAIAGCYAIARVVTYAAPIDDEAHGDWPAVPQQMLSEHGESN